MSICPVGAKSFHVDRQTDMTKLTVAFCNFANVPKKLFIQYSAPYHHSNGSKLHVCLTFTLD